MPANKNALIRYKTIDNCLRNRYRRWTLDDLVEACCNAIYDMEGISKGVSVRTVQGDIQIMRSDKLGYNAPIEVYDHKFYRYSDPDYSITNMPMSQNDYEVLQEAIDMLRQLEDFEQFAEMTDVVRRLQDKLAISKNQRKPIVHFDSVPDLKGLKLLNPLYGYIVRRQTVRLLYQSFNASSPTEYVLFPYLLKEFRNRWFLFGGRSSDMHIFNLPLDRIVSVEPSDVPFRENPEFNPEKFFDDVIGVSKNIKSTPRRIKFWASAEQSKYIKTKPIHHSQKLKSENPDDGSCIFQIEVVVNFEMYSVFMSYGPGVRIIYPRNVVAYMRDMLRRAADSYDEADIEESSEL
ncbi:Predicted DNA-binding transcriptional regulator YafY, contains an HTH and WYL domains [Bacteroidales bacterium KHT7]|nr:Predicted DNA-binding transcriptional regulator YafY, contains an HTH and WYL domains [Bacteroidales bacterium KHT7]